jgi:hypothetical protein
VRLAACVRGAFIKIGQGENMNAGGTGNIFIPIEKVLLEFA